jgi:hypothetical protein
MIHELSLDGERRAVRNARPTTIKDPIIFI